MKKYFLVFLALTLAVPVAIVAACSSKSTTTTVPVGTTLDFMVQPAGATAGTAFTTQPEVAATDDLGNVATSFDGAITLTITSGTGASGANLTGSATVDAVDGVAYFDGLSIDTAGSAYTLTAAASGLTSAVSSSFDVSAAIPVATTFAFTTQPSGATTGVAFTTQPVISAVDANGNVDTSYNGTITLAITSGTGASGANIEGTVTVTAVNGVATFSGLSIDTAGTGYTLTATGGTLTSATSASFDVTAAPATS
jgi:hypothetical protein